MKKLLLILLIAPTLYGQVKIPQKEHFNFSTSIEPFSSIKEESIDITLELEYEGRGIYVKTSTQVFPVIEGGYVDLAGGIGLNLSAGQFEDWRLYSGIRLGSIFRGGQTYPLFGFESGVNYNVTETFFIGLRSTYDYREDFEFWGGESEYRFNGSVRFGVRF